MTDTDPGDPTKTDPQQPTRPNPNPNPDPVRPPEQPPLLPGPEPEPAPPTQPAPALSEGDTYYDYGFRPFKIRQAAIQAAETELDMRRDAAFEAGEDMTDTPYCGCSTCEERLTAAFWIDWTISALSSGDLELLPVDSSA